MAEFVREKVARGGYAPDSEVLRDALRALRERDNAIKAWLREQVVPAAKALRANPERALSADESSCGTEEIPRGPQMNVRVQFAPEALAQIQAPNSV
jgi:putative addiction module CopG family antidote